MWKTKEIVLLPTKGFSPLYKEEDGSLAFDEVLHSYGGVDHYHLYVFGEDKIEPGDWCYDGKRVFQYLINDKTENGINEYSKKVIATTDKTLKYGEDVPGIIQYKFLPWIPASFIKDTFIQKPNLTFVDVEYFTVSKSKPQDNFWDYISHTEHELSVKEKNVINIKEVGNPRKTLKEMIDEDAYLKEELRMYCTQAFFAGYDNKSLSAEETQKVYDKWIRRNIKIE